MSPDCSHRLVDDSATHSEDASELQQFGRSLGQWSLCLPYASGRLDCRFSHKLTLTTREALLFEIYYGCTR
jgi:hypothetical protein